MRTMTSLLLGVFLLAGFTQAWAGKAEDEEMERMQKELNKEVMDKPFFAEQPEKVDAYIAEAAKKNIKPPEYTGPNWRPGYTCHDMLRYSWQEYRDCRYYQHYYGYPYRYR